MPITERTEAERETDWELKVEELFQHYVADLNFGGRNHKYRPADVHTLVVGNMRRLWWDIARGTVPSPSTIGVPDTTPSQ